MTEKMTSGQILGRLAQTLDATATVLREASGQLGADDRAALREDLTETLQRHLTEARTVLDTAEAVLAQHGVTLGGETDGDAIR